MLLGRLTRSGMAPARAGAGRQNRHRHHVGRDRRGDDCGSQRLHEMSDHARPELGTHERPGNVEAPAVVVDHDVIVGCNSMKCGGEVVRSVHTDPPRAGTRTPNNKYAADALQPLRLGIKMSKAKEAPFPGSCPGWIRWPACMERFFPLATHQECPSKSCVLVNGGSPQPGDEGRPSASSPAPASGVLQRVETTHLNRTRFSTC